MKKIGIFFCATAMSLCLITPHPIALATENDGLTPTVAKAYLSLLEPIQKQYGVAITGDEDNIYGLVAALLLDFDKDGTPELYYCYADKEYNDWKYNYKQYLYTYKNNQLVKLDIPLTPEYAAGSGYYTIHDGPKQAYLFWGEDVSPYRAYYWGVKDNALTTFLVYTVQESYTLNGNPSSWPEIEKAMLDIEEGTTAYQHFFVNESTNRCKSQVLSTLSTLKNLQNTTAKISSSNITLNGKSVSIGAYIIEGNNYFKLRDLAALLNGTEKSFSVSWEASTNRIDLLAGQSYKPVGGELKALPEGSKSAKLTSDTVYWNGEKLNLTAYFIGGNNYFKLRDLGEAMDFGVEWDNATKTVLLDTTKGYTP